MQIKWGLIDPGTRFFKGKDFPVLQNSWKLDAVKNGVVFAQAVVECEEPAVATLGPSLAFDWTGKLPRVRVEALWTDGQGQPLEQAPAAASLQWVGYIPDDNGDLSGDPLLATESITLEAGEAYAVWVGITTNKTATPGVYKLDLNLYLQQGWDVEERVATASVAVRVHDVTLPDPTDYSFYLDLWQHHTRWAQYYNVPRWSERHWSIIEAFAAELAKGGQKVVTVVASDAPWAGQGCWDVPEEPFAFYEFNTIGVTRGKDGRLRCDFTVMDRLIETYAKVGIDEEIEIIGLLGAWHDVFGSPLEDYPDPIRVRVFDEDTGQYDFIRTKDELATYVRLLVNHLKARGWFEKARISSDEPSDIPRFQTCIDFLRGIEPDLRFKIACNHAEFMSASLDTILDWVPNLSSLTNDAALTRRLTKEIHARGGRMSWYVCLRPEYPNNFLHSPTYETRLLGWLTDWFGIDGFLRWAFGAWAPDTWNKPAWKFPGGDLYLVYPGPDGAPLSSVRWEMLKLAAQEFELLRTLRQKIDALTDEQKQAELKERLADLVSRVIIVDDLGEFRVDQRQPDELYATDPATYDVARAEVIRLLTELQ